MPNFRWICPKTMEKWHFFGALRAHKILILLNFAQKSLSYYPSPPGHSEEYSPMSPIPPILINQLYNLIVSILAYIFFHSYNFLSSFLSWQFYLCPNNNALCTNILFRELVVFPIKYEYYQAQGYLSRQTSNLRDDPEIGSGMGWPTHHHEWISEYSSALWRSAFFGKIQ